MKNILPGGVTPGRTLEPMQVYILAGLSLIIGLAIGYVLRAGHLQTVTPPSAETQSLAPATAPAPVAANAKQPTLEDIRKMADTQAAPLLNKLKTDPRNSKVLEQVGATYYEGHQFKLAAEYYGKAAQADPKNSAVRVKLAGALFQSGNPNGAITQLNQVLEQEPNNPNALFNLGAIRLNAKKDPKGALAAWNQLLKTNPQLEPERKAQVEHLIEQVQAKNNTGNEQGAANAQSK